MKAAELTAAARTLIAVTNRKLGSSRFLAGALLLRQGLEEAVDAFWTRSVPAMTNVSSRAQLISLPFYLDARLAADVTYAWYRLSATCHHDAYELPPAPGELDHLADIVERLLAASPASTGSGVLGGGGAPDLLPSAGLPS